MLSRVTTWPKPFCHIWDNYFKVFQLQMTPHGKRLPYLQTYLVSISCYAYLLKDYEELGFC